MMPTSAGSIRSARRADVPSIVLLLANDALGSTRERVTEPPLPAYYNAFDAIDRDPNNTLIVVEHGEQVVGVLQLTLIPNLTYEGSWRAQIEGVRVAERMRGQGVGRALIEHAVNYAREAGCRLVQLTTDKRRQDSLRFYESIGFRATHEGMKLLLRTT